MNILFRSAVILLVSFAISAALIAQEDETGKTQETSYKDTPYFSAMPNYEIRDVDDKEFEAYDFFDGKNLIRIEGVYYNRTYSLKEGKKAASELQIRRNYITAVKNAGGKVLFEGSCDKCEDSRSVGTMIWGTLSKDGSEVWVEVYPYNDGYVYQLIVVQKEAMKQEVTASDMFKALEADGRVALYINFDVNKATIKTESRPIIDQILALLKENPKLSLSIEGHTDNSGDPKRNKSLSEARAASVRSVLTTEGIAASRLSTVGWGQEKPIADNSTDEGKAKNRRVELVKK